MEKKIRMIVGRVYLNFPWRLKKNLMFRAAGCVPPPKLRILERKERDRGSEGVDIAAAFVGKRMGEIE